MVIRCFKCGNYSTKCCCCRSQVAETRPISVVSLYKPLQAPPLRRKRTSIQLCGTKVMNITRCDELTHRCDLRWAARAISRHGRGASPALLLLLLLPAVMPMVMVSQNNRRLVPPTTTLLLLQMTMPDLELTTLAGDPHAPIALMKRERCCSMVSRAHTRCTLYRQEGPSTRMKIQK